jgi:hypothetical protein
MDLVDIASAYGYPYSRIDVSLRLDGPDGKPTGAVLTSGTITIDNPYPRPIIKTFQPTGQTLLQGGTAYWLVLAPHDSTSSGAWIYSSTNAGYVAFANTPTPSSADWKKVLLTGMPQTAGVPEFRVSIVPEPTVLSIAFVALAVFGHRVFRSGQRGTGIGR